MIRYAVLGSGSSANSYIIQYEPSLDKETTITVVIDNGFSLREFTRRSESAGFNPADIDFLFLTHDHADHIKGIGKLSEKYRIPVVMSREASLSNSHLERIHESLVVEEGREYSYNSLNFSVFRTFHDSAGSVGYSFNIQGKIFTIITDTGVITEEMEKHASVSDVLFLEANYCPDMLENGPYPWFLKNRIASDHGHLSNNDAVEFIEKLHSTEKKDRKIYLCHLSDKNNCPDKLESLVRERLGGNPEIDCRICRKGETVEGIPVKIK